MGMVLCSGNGIVSMEIVLCPLERYYAHGNGIMSMDIVSCSWKWCYVHGDGIISLIGDGIWDRIVLTQC